MADARVALVTGAARGIGAATVTRLCREGYRVVAVDSCGVGGEPPGVAYPLAREQDLQAVARAHPDRVHPVIADVRDVEALRQAVSEGIRAFGRLDAVVAAAAVLVGGSPLWETSEEEMQTLIEIDLLGVWNTARATIPVMLEGPAPSGCRFVAVASAAGSQGLFRLAGYTIAKHGVIGLVRGLAADLVGTGIAAIAVSPGSTDTAMLAATAEMYGVDAVGDLADSMLIRRVLSADELAATIAFCCSIEGAALNGSVVSATGGFAGS